MLYSAVFGPAPQAGRLPTLRMPRHHNPVVRSLLVVAAACAAFAIFPLATSGEDSRPWPPERLQDTGLYSDWASRTIHPDNLPFSPQYPLWTDGATKHRWIYLPPGSFIDGSNPDEWQFPVGTRLWKEFRFGRRAETRYIEHTAEGWRYAAYTWNEDESAATLAPERGVARTVEIRDGVRHAIPSRFDCKACHEASPTRVLGFSALQLSTDRDALAPHAEPLPSGAVDLASLVATGRLRGLPAHVTSAPRIAATTPTARAALGYLHSNCGSCHTNGGELASLEFSLRALVAPGPGDAVSTSVGRTSRFVFETLGPAAVRIKPGDPDGSVLVARMATRHPVRQMPPLGSQFVDDAGLALIKRWIAEDLPAHP